MQTRNEGNALQKAGRVPAVQGVLHPMPVGDVCYNCATPLLGHWCYRCGQHAEDYHRSTRVLFWEAMEHLFSTDGRVWHTLPRLLTRPGELTREYLAGKRVRQVPPLRLFFVVLIILFLVGGLVSRSHHVDLVHFNKPGDMAEAEKTISQMNVQLFGPVNATLTRWARTRLGAAVEHPDELGAAMGEWAHDFAFMTLPISALILSAMFMFRRRYVLFDHLIFTMHSMSFQGMLVTLVLTLRGLTGGAIVYMLWLAPVHLFVHMRGVYQTSIIGTLLRMAVLFLVCSFVFALLMAALVVAGLASLRVPA